MADRGPDHTVREVGEATVRSTGRAVNPDTSGHSQPVDAGRTSGGGSLGHKPTPEVEEEAPLRNNEPVMPADDSTLRTKI